MTSLLPGIIYGVVVLHLATAIEFRGYKMYDPTPANDPTEEVLLNHINAVYVKSSKETQITLPPDSGRPEAFEIQGLYKPGPTSIVRNHTKGTAHGVNLVYANMHSGAADVFDVPEGKSQGSRILCEEGDILGKKKEIRCFTLASGWRSPSLPSSLYVFQHVVHSQLHTFMIKNGLYVFYMLREHDAGALHIDFDGDADLHVWYSSGVEFETDPPTLSSLSSPATKYEKKFAIIGELAAKPEQEASSDIKMSSLVEFVRLKRQTNADLSKCTNEYVTFGPTRVTFEELGGTIIIRRNMDEVYGTTSNNCFFIKSERPTKELLTDTLKTPDHPVADDEIVIYEARASPAEPFYAVALSYQPELDHAKHGHHFAIVNDMVVHLDDLRYAGEMLYPLDEYTDVVHLFRSTPAIKLQVIPFDYAFKVLPYWMDQCMPHMENEPLHNYYEAISHSGPRFERYNIWADTIITKTQCVNTSLLNVSFAEHHTERVPINGTMETVERDMSEAYEEYDDIHVDQRNPCNDINVLSKIKRTTKNVSKKDTIILEAKDDEPLGITINLEEGEKFLVRFFNVERDESKCQDLDTVAIFLKDDMLVNQKAYIRTLTYEALIKRHKTWTGTGKLTIAIPNGCFRVEVVSVFSIQRSKYLRNIRACVVVMALTIIWSGTAILLYYKFSLAGRAYRRLRRLYKRAKRHDHFVRHYLEWKENVEEIIAAWEKVPDDH